jgi:hypothetical protein
MNQRRQIHSPIAQEEYAPNYKTMRSSRIKTARTLFYANQSHTGKESSSHPEPNPIHGLIAKNSSSIPENTSSTSPYLANKTSSSTICSLNRGHNIGPSNTGPPLRQRAECTTQRTVSENDSNAE